MSVPGRAHIGQALLVAVCILLSNCVKNPVTGSRQLVLISEAQEIAMGQAAHPEILNQFGVVEDESLQAYFRQLGLALAKDSHRPDLPWQFTILDSPVINAFAVPGGHIYLTRGILAYMNNEAELAGVTGHEIGHVTARHSVTQMSQQQLMGLGLGLGSIFSPTFRQLSQAAEMGLGILFLKYSRDHERQADEIGIQYMSHGGYDPEQMSRFFEVFDQMDERQDQAIPNWLSTHPAPPDRIEATAELAQQVKSANPEMEYSVGADAFLRRLNGMIHGENPREGFVDGARFVHPDLRFQMDFPRQWKVQNSKAAVLFVEPQGGAALQMTLVPPDFAASPEGAAEKIAQDQNIELVESRRTRIHGNQALIGLYRVYDQRGTIGVMAAFISYRANLYQIVGMAPEDTFAQFSRAFEESLTSFRELRDRRILDVQPDRLKLHRCRQGETLRSIARSYVNERLSVEDLARINRLDPDQRLPAGKSIKLVEAGR
jgi:predicted Zn-dependent protease